MVKVMKNLLTMIALAAAASSALAADPSQVSKSIELKDGSTVYVFKDGKMAMEDKAGRVTRMKQGHVMDARSGEQIVMVGDEVARLDWLKVKDAAPGGN